MNDNEVVSTKDIAEIFRCSTDHVGRHRRAIRTAKGYQPYALLTRKDVMDWKELYNRLTPAERKAYFLGLKVEKGGVEV